jgi:hypothetical protein
MPSRAALSQREREEGAIARNSFSGVAFRPGQTYAGVFPDRFAGGLLETR